MEKMDQYHLATKRGEGQNAQKALQQALSLESQAASKIPLELEPTRSIIYRSAASIAMLAGRVGDMRKLVAEALRGNPSREIMSELCDLLTRDVNLSPESIVQTLTIRRGKKGNQAVPIALVTQIEKYWSHLFKMSSSIFNIEPELYPIQAINGSYQLKIRVSVKDGMIPQAFDALRHLRSMAHKNWPPETPTELSLSSAFLALMKTLSEHSARLEVRMESAGSPNSTESFEFSTLDLAVAQHLQGVSSSVVDSSHVPQANILKKVFRFIDILASGEYPTSEDLGMGNRKRQVNYYRHALEVLGFYDSGLLTSSGQQIASLHAIEDRYRCTVVHFESSRVGYAWIQWSGVNYLSEVEPESAMDFLESQAIGLAQSTITRRANSLTSWCNTLAPFHYSKASRQLTLI